MVEDVLQTPSWVGDADEGWVWPGVGPLPRAPVMLVTMLEKMAIFLVFEVDRRLLGGGRERIENGCESWLILASLS